MSHKIVNGLHILTSRKGRVSVYTELEYANLQWWELIRLKYELYTSKNK